MTANVNISGLVPNEIIEANLDRFREADKRKEDFLIVSCFLPTFAMSNHLKNLQWTLLDLSQPVTYSYGHSIPDKLPNGAGEFSLM
jgi:hypothetical protein